MTKRERFWGGKRINPRPQKLKSPSCRGDATPSLVPNILQLNVEGLTPSKICVISQLVARHKALVILLQETHCNKADQLAIPNFSLAGSVLSRKHGLATFVYDKLCWTLTDQSPDGSAMEWLCVDVDGLKIINVYKPPSSQFLPTAIPLFPHPSVYAGDFNCQHTNWGYNTSSPDGESLVDWATKGSLVFCSIQRTPTASSLVGGIREQTPTWHLRAQPSMAGAWTDVF